MTRLRTDDIKDISFQLDQYEIDLKRKTGQDIRGIVSHSLGISVQEFDSIKRSVSIAAVPIRSGEGEIPRFSETIKIIVSHIGFDAFVTDSADVSGIAEAVEKGADIIMMADDNRFISFCPGSGCVSDNSEATAKVFIAGLDLMSGGIDKKDLLVIGAGAVGRYGVISALLRGANVHLLDTEIEKSRKLEAEMKKLYDKTVTIITSDNQAEFLMTGYDLIFEATNTSDVIDESDITLNTFIAAPGMPLGLTPAAAVKAGDRLLHDPLQLGVCAMAVESAKDCRNEEQ